MTVAIDIGNGALKLASVLDGHVARVERIPTDPTPDPLELAERIAEHAFEGPPGAPIAVVSVVPAITEVVREALRVIGARMLLADAAAIPIRADVPHPARVGPDRLLAAWGGSLHRTVPLIVVDLGTATTVDAVDADGAFCGGAILPGMALGADALASGTALLPAVALEPPGHAIGRDTLAALRSGIVLGHLGAIREVVTRIARELAPDGPRPPVLATGGPTHAPWMREALLRDEGPDLPPIADAVDADLLLRSLGLLAAHHAPVAR